jgi:branched-chain amino acid transport system ATP-binding protein
VAVVTHQLEISDVSKAFGGVQAVARVSQNVNQGEILSIIGPNGAGKTTLLNMISGFYHPDTGRILLDGADVTHLAQPRGRAGVRARSRTSRSSGA